MSPRSRRPATAGMLVGLTLGAACAGAASVAVGPATLTGVLLGEASPLTTAPAVSRQLGNAAGHEQNNRLATSTADAPAGTTSASPTTTSTTTVTSTTTTTTASKPPADTSATARVLDLVNQARAAAGCQALTEDKRLDKAAQGHSDDMSAHSYFSHTSQDGRTFVDREEQAGYTSPGGENIAEGYTSADAVMDGWMHSDGHRRNILDCSFTTIGIGVTTKGWYWVQDFGR